MGLRGLAWPEVGVEFELEGSGLRHVIWGSEVEQFNLQLGAGPISQQWSRLESNPEEVPFWSVADHPMWRAMMAEPLSRVELLGEVPVALQLVAGEGEAWVLAAQPSERPARPGLTSDKLWWMSDEVIVVFGSDTPAKLWSEAPDEML